MAQTYVCTPFVLLPCCKRVFTNAFSVCFHLLCCQRHTKPPVSNNQNFREKNKKKTLYQSMIRALKPELISRLTLLSFSSLNSRLFIFLLPFLSLRSSMFSTNYINMLNDKLKKKNYRVVHKFVEKP